MAKHTKEPWRYVTNVGPTKAKIVSNDGTTIMDCANPLRSSEFEANVRRMLVCVNALAGISETDLALVLGAETDAARFAALSLVAERAMKGTQ